MLKFLIFLIISLNAFATEWCPDKIAVAPIMHNKKIQPLFFVAENLLKDFNYSYKLRSSTVFCLVSLKHKGIDQTTELYPPLKYQKELKTKYKKNVISMEDLFLDKNKTISPELEDLVNKYARIRNGESWNVPVIFGENVKWESLNKLSINEMFSERISNIKVQYVEVFGLSYLYEYYFYIFLRLFLIGFLVIGFIFIKIKHSKHI